jgi:hypothetical protein
LTFGLLSQLGEALLFWEADRPPRAMLQHELKGCTS